jgi:hypothetical protein
MAGLNYFFCCMKKVGGEEPLKQRKVLFFFSLTFFVCFWFVSCLKDKASSEYVCDFHEVNFSENILPIMTANCTGSGCHDGSSYLGNFSKYEDIKIRADNGNLYLMVIEKRSMPPDKSLAETDIDLIRCWIEKGASE